MQKLLVHYLAPEASNFVMANVFIKLKGGGKNAEFGRVKLGDYRDQQDRHECLSYSCSLCHFEETGLTFR